MPDPTPTPRLTPERRAEIENCARAAASFEVFTGKVDAWKNLYARDVDQLLAAHDALAAELADARVRLGLARTKNDSLSRKLAKAYELIEADERNEALRLTLPYMVAMEEDKAAAAERMLHNASRLLDGVAKPDVEDQL